ncbi:MAG: class I SAM-dependent methyltransferase [Planctomycetota bacterium]|nr:class I SAM-dependent methyltransferase [Planctomycetota bacterium]
MDEKIIDWAALQRLRASFLEGSAGRADYWRTPDDLASYDETFGQRIAWKWDYVLSELVRRGWTPPPGPALDWGCGSGTAGRAVLAHFGQKSVSGLALWDRSQLAMKFAATAARKALPGLSVECGPPPLAAPATMLISHVLTELSPAQEANLLAQAARATAVLWIEPGTQIAAGRLVAARERLREAFQLVAPCPHQCPCGMLAPAAARHWCHHFAPTPSEAFMSGAWARFSRIAGVDLRSLPLAYMVLDKRPAPPLPQGTVRVIGRPRILKAYALATSCEPDGIHERRVMKRILPQEFRAMKRCQFATLQAWQLDGDEVAAAGPV